VPWPHDALRHSFASYHLAKFQNAPSLALELGHQSNALIFSNYRRRVTPDTHGPDHGNPSKTRSIFSGLRCINSVRSTGASLLWCQDGMEAQFLPTAFPIRMIPIDEFRLLEYRH
jgi:hypothetical protein